ncbi:hypothetical protein DRQ33_05075 [bacterium]|nr:MAG: hypothetical protein DRQ33_05075 [bacterium]
MKPENTKANRVINTFTGHWEKKILPQIARALPRFVVPDHLTILGVISALAIFIGYILTRFSIYWIWLSNFGLIIHWFADSLDGTLARVRHIERENYGYFVDHICDAVTVFMVCVGLGLSPLMDLRVALYLAVAYLMLNVYAHIAAYSEKIFKLSYGKFGPTEVRIVLFIINIVVIFWNPVVFYLFGHPLTAMDVAGIIVATTFMVIFAIASIKDAIKLDREDRAKWNE